MKILKYCMFFSMKNQKKWSLIFEQKIGGFHGFSENSQISADSISMKTFSISKNVTIYNTYVPRSVHCAMFRGAVGFLKIRFRSMKLEEFPKFHFHHPTQDEPGQGAKSENLEICMYK